MTPLVVLPTYQEAENVETVLRRIRAALPDAHVLVVDDGSPDGTADLAEKLAEELGGVDVLRRPGKEGLGSAYRAGFRWGLDRDFDVLVEMDADLSHAPEDLPALLAVIAGGGADLVLGSRYVPGGATPEWPRIRRFLSVWANRYAAAALGLAVNDATAGFRAYTAAVLRRIDLEHSRAEGYGFQVEMVYRVVRLGGRIVEVPITFTDRLEGRSKMSGRIVVEALALVTLWGLRDLLTGRRRQR
ncbi:MAG TPA: polyprenol monophosphomannose synthase [Acidimicrobiales bacterium]|nr:polyprenol monophosphomannose synthase [Acidimicrobiales bacterium]